MGGGRGWGGRGPAREGGGRVGELGAGGEGPRERGEEREKIRERKRGRRRPADRRWVTGVGGGSLASVAGGEKVADDREDFGWEG
ncbi:hypothetical protein TIFTF001_018395 [Ficus carica]|uniref:Uncharacterized protein n=1 Tax=Ficus carica TaxID=3494 RepID=A0AA88A6Z0_FICCA|nr:hypothetical protein TIFTF001_018395 [Ficus carica]